MRRIHLSAADHDETGLVACQAPRSCFTAICTRSFPSGTLNADGRPYTEDVTFIDPEGEFIGRQALSDRARELLDGILAGFVFEEDGPRYVGADTAALAWRFGPPGSPVARGIDILTIRDGRVSVVRTLIASETDA